ncbi:threonine-phosphate decarboxylase [Edwardsiella hoshinae]|uniref:threonine-phosphate decarboxylase n=1 Tax=Edwardsiella hoshinae TaxID=93378 RepID=A0A376DHC3_9GAMM|nr:threonine-phosphate decarboxylase CobD [Edwardsiella hoshinae]QPR27108.1 threonine-phosphate decarboxylase [Edwardsiella hoshinae]STC88441.1 Threonine-phosphate decarboxylase [Edwardsiella hoshinae]
MLLSPHGGDVVGVAEQLGVAVHSLTDFSANINPWGMPDTLRQALHAQLDLAQPYPDLDYRALHRALAAHHQLPPEWIVAGNGETELIFNLVEALQPRQALLLTPSFAEYRRALQRVGCTLRHYTLRAETGFTVDGALLDAINADLDCVFLCTPNNPTGLTVSPELLLALAERCQRLGVRLIVDEAFWDFIADEPGAIPLLARFPTLCVLRSLTKFYAIAGLRLGYLLSADQALTAQVRALRHPWSINAFAALAGEWVLRDDDYRQRTLAWLAHERPWLQAALQALTGLTVWPGRANYLLLRCERPALDLRQALLAHGLLIRSCANYPGLDARYYRVCVRLRPDNARLIAALRQVLSRDAG